MRVRTRWAAAAPVPRNLSNLPMVGVVKDIQTGVILHSRLPR